MTQHDEKAELERQLGEERAQRAAEASDEPGDDELEEELEEEVEEEAEPEAEPEPEPDEEEVSDELRARRLGRAVDAFELELRGIFGVDEPLEQVAVDGAIGFMVPGVLALKANEKYRRCPVCNGHGAVLTGSIADGKQTADCPRCAGRGYLERLENPTPPTAEQANGTGTGDDDAAFGVPAWMGDPNIGATA